MLAGRSLPAGRYAPIATFLSEQSAVAGQYTGLPLYAGLSVRVYQLAKRVSLSRVRLLIASRLGQRPHRPTAISGAAASAPSRLASAETGMIWPRSGRERWPGCAVDLQ